jgi:hypothetical protein
VLAARSGVRIESAMISFAVPRYITSNHEWKVKAVKVAFNSLTCGGALIARGLGAHHPLIAFLKMQMPHY